jgi:hypothetical protein
MRLIHPTRFRYEQGFYNFELSFVGALLIIVAGLLVPTLFRAGLKGLAFGGICVGIIGLAFSVYDWIRYRRIQRESRKSAQESRNDKPVA